MAEIRVRVTCHDCEPGVGELVPLGGDGKPEGAAVKIAGPARAEADATVTGVRHYHYVVPVTPQRVGANAYEMRWPDLCPASAPRILAQRIEVDAQGAIEAKQRLAHAGEEVALRAAVHPSRRPAVGAPLVLHVVDAPDRDKEPVAVELHDDGKAESGDERAGDGVYSAKYRFPDAGTFEVVCPADSTAGPLKSEAVRVGFELRHAEQLGTLDRGAPDVPGGLLGREELSDPKMLHLVNRLPEACRWRARLRDADPDGSPRLDARLTGGAKGEAGGALAGTLAHDQALDLGIDVKLPAAAEDGTSALLLEVDLEWVDGRGQVVARRGLRLPLSVAVRDWKANPKVWILSGAALAVVGFVAFRGARWLRRPRKAAPVAARPAPPAVAQAPAPVPRSFVPPRPGDEGIPEHMR
jgi:hypothetical protein